VAAIGAADPGDKRLCRVLAVSGIEDMEGIGGSPGVQDTRRGSTFNVQLCLIVLVGRV
jgi:hypothetical protein